MAARVPGHAPRRLDRLAAACLQASANDSRLGDLSELYVRTHERARRLLGATPLAMAASRAIADLHYLVSAGNVVLFARAVDPALRLAQPERRAMIAVELREKAMTVLHGTARTLLLPALLLAGSAFLIHGALTVWNTWKETEALIVDLHREKAQAAARQIDQYFAMVQEQVAWTTRSGSAPADQRRHDYLRLMRQVAAVAEIAQLDAHGKELLRVSRWAVDRVDGRADHSGDPLFTEALKRKQSVGSLHLDARSEPHVTLAMAGPGAGVTLAEINIKRVWDIVDVVTIGRSGSIRVVDEEGRLLASRDGESVARHAKLSSAPKPANTAGAERLSVHAAVPGPGWKVLVDVPVAEVRAPLWSALLRGAFLLALAVLTILLATLSASRRSAPVRGA
jgi:hypothetical protein